MEDLLAEGEKPSQADPSGSQIRFILLLSGKKKPLVQCSNMY